MAIIKTISDLLWGMPLIVLILLAGIIFTVGSKFFQIAHLKHKAGALGITSYEDKNGIEYYVMIVCLLYTSDAADEL